ncbi:MAG: hypothetical protein Ta2D_12450 [Rickettsiales bacterium]|nr:MAG: hypothetical protein Ta2D_12450 [Rickettsiales bacterium]
MFKMERNLKNNSCDLGYVKDNIYIIIYLLLTLLPLLSLKRYYRVNHTTIYQPLFLILITLLFINFFIVKIIKKCNDRYKLIDRIVKGTKQHSNILFVSIISIILIIPSFTKIPKNEIHFKTKDKKSIVINYKVGNHFDNWFKYNFKTNKFYLKRNYKIVDKIGSPNLKRNQFLYELNLLIFEYPHLKDIDFMNTFIIDVGNGLADQVREFLGGYYNIYTKTNNKYKYKFIITDSGGHGGNIIKYYNFSKYMDFKLIKIPNDIFDLYNKYSINLHYFIINDYSDLKLEPPLISKTCILPFPFILCATSDKIDITTFRDMMQLQIPLNEPNKQKLQQIRQSENSVAIHIRMGDILYTNPVVMGLLQRYLPKVSYFKKSIIDISKEIIKQKKTNKPINITFFIFSNSMDLVKARLNNKELQALKNEINKIQQVNITFDFVDINKDEEPYFELELLKNCQHFIISGGGFSRLASYLGEYKDKIIIEPNDDDFLDVEEKKKDWGYK